MRPSRARHSSSTVSTSLGSARSSPTTPTASLTSVLSDRTNRRLAERVEESRSTTSAPGRPSYGSRSNQNLRFDVPAAVKQRSRRNGSQVAEGQAAWESGETMPRTRPQDVYWPPTGRDPGSSVDHDLETDLALERRAAAYSETAQVWSPTTPSSGTWPQFWTATTARREETNGSGQAHPRLVRRDSRSARLCLERFERQRREDYGSARTVIRHVEFSSSRGNRRFDINAEGNNAQVTFGGISERSPSKAEAVTAAAAFPERSVAATASFIGVFGSSGNSLCKIWLNEYAPEAELRVNE